MDGTLTRTNPLIFASFNHIASRHLGITLTPAEILALFGPPEEGGLARLLGRDDVREEMEDLCGFYAEHHDRLASLHDGILPVLHGLKARGIIRTLFTGKGRRTTEITMRAFGLEPLLDMVVTGSDVTRHKPDPEGILNILGSFGVARENTLMVGDSMADCRAARGAGVPFAAVTWDTTQEHVLRQASPDYLFPSVPDLAAFLLRGAA
jgi:HAD superfamily hydrolase (TIGR01509 family)